MFLIFLAFNSHDRADGAPLLVAGRRYNYIFYIDFIGSLSDETCQNALRHLKEFAPFLRVLGSYPLLEVDVPSGAAEDAS
jgi:hypothetical protein